MKITIEFDGSTDANLTIDGRKLSVNLRPGESSIGGIKHPELGETFGGFVASQLHSPIANILQAWAVASPVEPVKPFAKLSEEILEEMEEVAW